MTSPGAGVRIVEERDGRSVDIFERNIESAGYPQPDTGLARSTYLVCFEERSGSTMLCSLIGQTDALGKPDEFFNPRGPMQMYLARSKARNIAEYYAYLHNDLSTANGVFGMKTTFADLQPLLSGEAFEQLLGEPRYVFLTREDIVRQAVSSALARKRSVWHAFAGRDAAPEDDGLAVDVPLVTGIMERIRDQRRAWDDFFSARGIAPLHVSYEEMTTDATATVKALGQYLGVELGDEQIPRASQTLQLSNATNEAWVEAVRSRTDA
ncbi:MAG: Stf0 family sulfotransferase [Chloroflexota bacterium]